MLAFNWGILGDLGRETRWLAHVRCRESQDSEGAKEALAENQGGEEERLAVYVSALTRSGAIRGNARLDA